MRFSSEVGGYLPRVTIHDSRAIEQALAGPSLFDPGLRLEGAIAEATFAAKNPPLLKRLREAGTPYLIEPQTMRFVSEAFLAIDRLASLSYAPASPIRSDALSVSDRREIVYQALSFQEHAGASGYLIPSFPVSAPGADVDLNLAVLRDATDIVGSEVDRRPLVAMLIPGRQMIAEPEGIVKPLADFPLDAVYVQPTRLHPTRDSVEHLVRHIAFLAVIADLGLPVIAGRVGAFGLVLQALGVGFFDSGLGDAESFDLAQLNRPRAKKPGAKSGGGRNRRIYLEHLKTTLVHKYATTILSDDGLRSRFVCNLRCCRFKGFEGIADRRREHYLHVRMNEVDRLRAEATPALRINRMHDQLVEAREHARVVRRVLSQQGIQPPDFTHLDRWLGCLTRAAGVTTAA